MTKPLPAVVLAGGRWKSEPPVGMSPWRALAPLSGRPTLGYILEALRGSSLVSEIYILGPPEVAAIEPGLPAIAPSNTLTGNVLAACRVLDQAERILLVGSDIPLVTPAGIDGLIRACSSEEIQLFYPVIEKAINLEKYPQMKRTFVRLSDGTFTGGNILVAHPTFLLERESQIEAIYAGRKSPLKLAAFLGWELVFRFLLTAVFRLPLLDVPTASKLVSRSLGGPVAGVLAPFPEIGADLDDPEEIPAFEQELMKAHRGHDGREH